MMVLDDVINLFSTVLFSECNFKFGKNGEFQQFADQPLRSVAGKQKNTLELTTKLLKDHRNSFVYQNSLSTNPYFNNRNTTTVVFFLWKSRPQQNKHLLSLL